MRFKVTVNTQRVYNVEADSPEYARQAVESGSARGHIHETHDSVDVRYVSPLELTGLGSRSTEDILCGRA